jgi:hypothetical protein
MHDNVEHDRSREIEAAWRSAGLHALARELVLVAREEGASDTLQTCIAETVLLTEAPPTQADIDYALRD